MERESFIFGSKNIPIWFDDEAKKGRINIKYDDGKIQKAIIMSGTKRYEAFPGDTIVYSKSGMVVIPKNFVDYKVVTKEEDTDEEDTDEEEIEED